MREGIRALVLLLLTLGLPVRSEAAGGSLPPAPFTVAVSASTIEVGAPASVRVGALAGQAPVAGPVDVYVVRLPGGPPVPRYLTPTGTWSTQPVPFGAGALPSRSAPLVATWREDGPPGWITLLVLFVSPGAEPVHRPAWVFQPVLTRIRIATAPAPLWPPPRDLALSVGATALAVLLVLTLPMRRPL